MTACLAMAGASRGCGTIRRRRHCDLRGRCAGCGSASWHRSRRAFGSAVRHWSCSLGLGWFGAGWHRGGGLLGSDGASAVAAARTAPACASPITTATATAAPAAAAGTRELWLGGFGGVRRRLMLWLDITRPHGR